MPLAFGNAGGYPGVNNGAPIVANPWGGYNPQQYQQQAMQKLAFSMSGPYDEQWQQSQINRNADATAQSSEQQMEALRSDASNRGLAFNDPSVQSEQRRIGEARRTQNIGMAGDVRRQAQGANYAGGMQAANAILNQSQNGPFGGGYTSYQPHVNNNTTGAVFTQRSPYQNTAGIRHTAPVKRTGVPAFNFNQPIPNL